MSRLPALPLLAAAVGVGPSSALAQTFDEGLVPPNVGVTVVPRPYPVEGDTPELLTAALRAIGLGGSWTRVSSFYEWIYDLEELSSALGANQRSGRCRFPRFRVDLRLTIEYPEWVRPASPDPLLVEAWDAFVGLMEQDFAERRSDVYAQLTELNRIARRLEIDCPMADITLDRMMDGLAEEQREEAREAYERGERTVLRWPPPGIERRADRGGGAASGVFLVPSATTVELPPTDPARLLEEAQLDAERLGGGALLVMAGHYRAGEVVYFEPAIDTPSPSGATIDRSAPRAFGGLTEVFVAALAGALDSANVLDLGAPIATYLPEIDPEIGRVTMRQLLSHRSGIHNAMPDTANDMDWYDGARTLDRRALFTEPGAIYSYSGYDYPLAIQVMEAVARTDFPTLAASALFRPLGMTSTSIGSRVRGMPLTSTTAADLMTFLTTWVDGGLRGAPQLTRPPSSMPSEGDRSFDLGVWYDEVAGVPRVSLVCGSGGFQLFPDTRTAFLLWTSGAWPNGVWRYLLSEVADAQGARDEALEPIGARGAGRLGAVDPTCSEPPALREQVLSLGAPTPAGDWAGLYRNGDQINELSDVDGFLKETNGQPLDVSHFRGDVHFVGLNGVAFYPLQLTRDTEGRRYLVLDGRAYIHQDDRPAR